MQWYLRDDDIVTPNRDEYCRSSPRLVAFTDARRIALLQATTNWERSTSARSALNLNVSTTHGCLKRNDVFVAPRATTSVHDLAHVHKMLLRCGAVPGTLMSHLPN